MSAVPPLARQGAYINVRDAGTIGTGPGTPEMGASFKGSSDTKPFHLEEVYGFTGTEIIKCKYDYIKKMWLDENDRQITPIQRWSATKSS